MREIMWAIMMLILFTLLVALFVFPMTYLHSTEYDRLGVMPHDRNRWLLTTTAVIIFVFIIGLGTFWRQGLFHPRSPFDVDQWLADRAQERYQSYRDMSNDPNWEPPRYWGWGSDWRYEIYQRIRVNDPNWMPPAHWGSPPFR